MVVKQNRTTLSGLFFSPSNYYYYYNHLSVTKIGW